MGTTEDIKQMRDQGKQDREIIETLKNKGLSAKEISDSLNQAKIKAAVGESENLESSTQELPGEEELQPSLMASETPSPYSALPQPQQSNQPRPYQPQYPQPPQYAPTPENSQEVQEYPQQYAPQQYQQNYESAPSISADTITEIAEQVATEKISEIRKALEKILDFKTSVDAKVSYLDERLKRIEQMIDRLQLSILQKVGAYVTNIEDMKNELVETQKSFKSLIAKKPAQSSRQDL